MLNDALRRNIPLVTDRPTIIFGADVTHPQPGEDSSPSIAAVCSVVFLPFFNLVVLNGSIDCHRLWLRWIGLRSSSTEDFSLHRLIVKKLLKISINHLRILKGA